MSNDVDKINGVSHDILKNQKVDGSILHDALELSFHVSDKASMLNVNNVDILASINNMAVSIDVYNRADIDLSCSSLVGAAPAVLNTIVELATALGNDSNYATTIQTQMNNTSDKLTTYSTTYVNVALGFLQAGIDNIGLTNAVDSNGKFKIQATSNDILKTQRVYGTILYDSCGLSFNTVDKTSIIQKQNVNILQAISNDDVDANVCSKSEIDIALNLKIKYTY